jgi:hypothetical protein
MEVCLNKVTTLKTLAVIAGLLAVSCTSLHPPGLISPAGAEGLLTTTPEFTWHPAGNARSYLVEISADQDFTETIDTMIFADTSFVLADTLMLGQDYYWRISSRTAQGAESQASEAETFYIKDGVQLLTPEASDSIAWPEFSWESYPGAVTYRFLISRYADFREVLLDTAVSTTALVWPDSLPPASYFWYVQAFNGDQHVSAPSVVRRLVSYRMADTYFPLYVGRTQSFTRVRGEGTFFLGDTGWDTTTWKVEQVTIEVENVQSEGTRFFWSLSDTLLWDIGSSVSVEQDSLYTSIFTMSGLFPAESSTFRSWQDSTYSVFYSNETLMIDSTKGNKGTGEYHRTVISRLPGKGLFRQIYYHEHIDSGDTHIWTLDSLELIP